MDPKTEYEDRNDSGWPDIEDDPDFYYDLSDEDWEYIPDIFDEIEEDDE